MSAPQGALPDIKLGITIGGPQTVIDGVSASLNANEWTRVDLPVEEPVHLQGVKVKWWDCQVGDYGFLCLIHPGGQSSPQTALSAGATQMTVEAGKGAVYAAAACVEFWDDADVALVEIAPIESVAGDVVTFKAPLASAHSVNATVRAQMACFATHRGLNKIDGGLRLNQSGWEEVASEYQVTESIPAGLILGGRFKTASGGISRTVVVNYKMRRPEA